MTSELLNKILLVIIGALIALIFCGTIIGVSRKRTQTPQVLISKGKAINLAAPVNTEIIEYYDLSTIRIVTNPDKNKKEDFGSAMVITPWLAYPKGDTVFFEEIERKYKEAGYERPGIVFWNVNGDAGNVPVTLRDKNIALISGYSPAIIQSVMKGEFLNPIQVMLVTVNSERYSKIKIV